MIVALWISSSSDLCAQIGFTKISKFKSTSSFYAVQTADINNDGLTDVIGATDYSWDYSPEDAKIFVYYQNTSGILAKETEIDYPKNYPGLRSLATGDLNNDQMIDIVISFSDSIGIFYQTSPKVFSKIEKHYTGRMTNRVMCRDINNDSLVDIITKNSDYQSQITIFEQTETGLKKQVITSPKHYSYEQFELGNFNSDQLSDILYFTTYDKSAERIYVMLQDSGKGYPNDSFNLQFSDYEDSKDILYDFAIGDLNDDKTDDVIALNPATDSLYFWTSNQSRFGKPAKVKTFEYGIHFDLIDLNCDCKKDILVLGDTRVAVHESADNFKSFGTSEIDGQAASPTMLDNKFATGDLDNDGKTDMAIAFLDGIVIMKNTSKPVNFASIDTIPRYDTLAYQNDTSKYNIFRKTIISSDQNRVITRKDSFNVVSRYKFLAYNLDTMFIRQAIFCSKHYIDTVYTQKVNRYFDEFNADTTLFYSSYDTLKTGIIIQEIADSELKVFPNPANDELNIVLPFSEESSSLVDIEILSSDGKEVFFSNEIKPVNHTVSLHIATLKSGIFLIRVKYQERSWLKKFIKN